MIDGPRTLQRLQEMRQGGFRPDALMREAVKQLNEMEAAEAVNCFLGCCGSLEWASP